MEKKQDGLIWSHDPSGVCFWKDGRIYRQIYNSYSDDYDYLMRSGLYDELVKRGLLVSHHEVGIDSEDKKQVYKIISPLEIPFISYPYEWCFSQLKDAALTTLEVQGIALKYGMSLKDSSAFNIQFYKGKPILIDTLSFKKYIPGSPWVAYRQFCQHFIAPLALMCRRDPRLILLFRTYHDGIPLDLASKLLPLRTHLSLYILSHIHFHSLLQLYFGNRRIKRNQISLSKHALEGLVDNLKTSVERMKLKKERTPMLHYYDDTTYTALGMEHKKQVVSEFIDMAKPKKLWDFGANIGSFSRIAGSKGVSVISFDNDHAAVEENYRICFEEHDANLLPLFVDLVNPTPSHGWACKEKMSLSTRGPVDMVFSLALLHHLSIGYSISFDVIAVFFAEICDYLIIEFIPRDDERVQQMLVNREDIYQSYTVDNFEHEFKKLFNIVSCVNIRDSVRTLYLMKKIRMKNECQ